MQGGYKKVSKLGGPKFGSITRSFKSHTHVRPALGAYECQEVRIGYQRDQAV